VWGRESLRTVRAGNPEKVRRVPRKHRRLLEEEETLPARYLDSLSATRATSELFPGS
jgi:hypothetical protein